jgi:hypothetical protein
MELLIFITLLRVINNFLGRSTLRRENMVSFTCCSCITSHILSKTIKDISFITIREGYNISEHSHGHFIRNLIMERKDVKRQAGLVRAFYVK